MTHHLEPHQILKVAPMNTNYKSDEAQSIFDKLQNSLSEKDLQDIDAKILMFRFLSLIDAKREELGWSRKDLAVQIKTSPSFISQLFQGDKLINFTTLAKIQKVMGLEFEITLKKTKIKRGSEPFQP